MRPRLFTLRNFVLVFVAALVFGGLSYWIKSGMPLPGGSVPSTAGKIAFVANRDGHPHIWMMSGVDGGGAVALTNGTANDTEPAWSQSGSEIVFTSANRAGLTSQIFYVDARSGARTLPLTNTSMTKAAPFFGPERRIYYLAAGRLASTNPENKDTDLEFPNAESVRALYGNSEQPGLLSTGGIVSAAVAPGGGAMAIVIKTEEGQALLLYDGSQTVGAVLGLGKNIFAHFLPDGRLMALYSKGDAAPELIALFNEKIIKGGGIVPALNFPMPNTESSSIVIHDLSTGKSQKLGALPLMPDAFAVSPDGSRCVLSFSKPLSDESGGAIGLLVLPTNPGPNDQPLPLFPNAAESPSWSPDSSEIAFVSGKDIYVVPATGGEAKNLTKGQGTNSSPVWSPAKSVTPSPAKVAEKK